jgi:hypothetical protein
MHACSNQGDYSLAQGNRQCDEDSTVFRNCQVNCISLEEAFCQDLWLQNISGLERTKEKIHPSPKTLLFPQPQPKNRNLEAQKGETFWTKENQKTLGFQSLPHDYSQVSRGPKFGRQTTKLSQALISKRICYETS